MINTNSLQLVNASSQYFSATSWKPTNFTLSAWIKPNAVAAIRYIFSGPNNDLEFYVTAGAKLQLSVWTGAAYEDYTSSASISAGAWTFVACTYTSASKAWALYIGTGSSADNSGTGSGTLTWEAPADAIYWGARQAATNHFYGLIDDLREYDTARSGANLASDNSQELVGNESNLYGYYKCNGNVTDSQSSSPHNGTSSGSPIFPSNVPFGGVSGGFLANFL